MVSAKSVVPSPLETVMQARFWNRNRGRVIGLLALAAVVLGIALFWRERVRSAEMAGWEQLEDLSVPGQLRTHVDLSGPVQGTDAEPYAIYNNAYSAFLDHDLDEAAALVARLETEFPDHVVNKGTKVAELKQDIEAEQAWTATHSFPENNPQPSENNIVTIKTELGDVVIGLYPEQSPSATRSFLELARTGALQAGRFDEAYAGSLLILSLAGDEEQDTEKEELAAEGESEASEEANEDDSEQVGDHAGDNAVDDAGEESDEETAAEPSPLALGRVPDRNHLSHYRGAVSFRRRSPAGVEADALPQIALYLADNPAMDRQQVVFGRVLEGLELLEQVATRVREKESVRLQEPLAVQEVIEGPGLVDLR